MASLSSQPGRSALPQRGSGGGVAVAELTNSAPSGAPRPLIELAGVRKSYMMVPTRTDVLRGVDLKIDRGDFISIMGPSGCGKSTLMHILGLLDQPGEGTYKLDGVDTAGMSDRECSDIRNASIGFVFQSFYLLPRLAAWENVGVPLVYRGLGQDRDPSAIP